MTIYPMRPLLIAGQLFMVGTIDLPQMVRSPKGVAVDLSEGYVARIDINNVSPGEGGFHTTYIISCIAFFVQGAESHWVVYAS